MPIYIIYMYVHMHAYEHTQIKYHYMMYKQKCCNVLCIFLHSYTTYEL
jgi:hypothetical protein